MQELSFKEEGIEKEKEEEMSKKVKVGDVVKWHCKSNGWFMAKGVVKKIGQSTFGSVRKTVALQIEPIGEYCKRFPNRRTTTISILNIK